MENDEGKEGTNWYWVFRTKTDPEMMKMLLTLNYKCKRRKGRCCFG